MTLPPWRPAACLARLRDQVDELQPSRPRDSDGMVGDARHQAESHSGHNPIPDPLDPHGPWVVRAWDCTTAAFIDDLFEQLRKIGATGDGRLLYLILKSRITSAAHGWQWAPYTEASQGHPVDPHESHGHVSVVDDPHQYDRTDPWPLAGLDHQEDDMQADERRWLQETHNVAIANGRLLGKVLVLLGTPGTELRADLSHLPADVVDEIAGRIAKR